jgi:hypothetical protein
VRGHILVSPSNVDMRTEGTHCPALASLCPWWLVTRDKYRCHTQVVCKCQSARASDAPADDEPERYIYKICDFGLARDLGAPVDSAGEGADGAEAHGADGVYRQMSSAKVPFRCVCLPELRAAPARSWCWQLPAGLIGGLPCILLCSF